MYLSDVDGASAPEKREKNTVSRFDLRNLWKIGDSFTRLILLNMNIDCATPVSRGYEYKHPVDLLLLSSGGEKNRFVSHHGTRHKALYCKDHRRRDRIIREVSKYVYISLRRAVFHVSSKSEMAFAEKRPNEINNFPRSGRFYP